MTAVAAAGSGAAGDGSGAYRIVDDELEVLGGLVPLAGQRVVELGCGGARLARALLDRHPDARVTGLEVDARQHAKNLANPHPGLEFVEGGAQAIPRPDASFDLALMLKSLHHVPLRVLGVALAETARVLRPGGLLYVSEPVYGGAFNDVTRIYHDEGVVRAAAQAALDDALAAGAWEQVAEVRFAIPATYRDFDEFEARMMRPTFVDLEIDDALRTRVREAFERHCGTGGARFERPMLARLLRRRG